MRSQESAIAIVYLDPRGRTGWDEERDSVPRKGQVNSPTTVLFPVPAQQLSRLLPILFVCD